MFNDRFHRSIHSEHSQPLKIIIKPLIQTILTWIEENANSPVHCENTIAHIIPRSINLY